MVTQRVRIVIQPDSAQVTTLHPDFDSKLYNYEGLYGGHGVYVAGLIGAATNNNSYLASSGYKTNLLGYHWDPANVDKALDDDNVDLLNMSFIGSVQSVVKKALLMEVPVIASAGNSTSTPYVAYPAAHYFDDVNDGTQVIAVSGSNIYDNFIDTTYTCDSAAVGPWNYSPGSNPLSDPIQGFVDIMAPGRHLRVLWSNYDLSSYSIGHYIQDHCYGGTSFSAPLVSGTVALILSINDIVTPKDIYEILTSSTDKVGQFSYDYYVDPKGWHPKLGYGRLNAYNSLRYTIEYYGATLGNEKPQVTLPLWEDISFHEDVHLVSGSTLTVEARDTTVTLFAASGTITIGGPPPSPKAIGGGRGLVQVPPTVDAPDPESRPGQLHLHPNYPNPFNPSTQIRWEMPNEGHARITVHDILGREVAVLIEGHKSAGQHTVTFDAIGLVSGIYLYRLETTFGVKTRKMTLIK